MNLSLRSKRNLVFALVLALATLLAGCAGGGGGGSTNTVQAQVQNGMFDGALSDGTGPVLDLKLKLVKNGSTQTGAVVFTDLGTGRGSGFQLSFGGVVENLVWGPAPGAISFDITQFSTLAPYLTLHFAGTYAPSSSGAILTGTVTGSKKGGASVNLTFTASMSPTQTVMDFSGYWVGNVTVSGAPIPYTATLAMDADKVKITGTVTAAGSTIPFTTGVRAGQTFFGEFAGDALGAPGTTGVWYVTASDASHFSGTYILMNSSNVIVGSGTITGTKGVPPGGPALQAGFLQGTLLPAGGTVTHSFRIEVTTATSTSGQNGAFIIDPTNGDASAGNINTLTGSGQTVTLSTSDLYGVYTAITFTGTVTTNNAQYTGTYSSTRTGGATETGTFTLVRSTSMAHFSLNGVYSGTIGTRAWSGNFVQTGSGTGFVATVGHDTSVNAAIYPIYGYVVGDQFVAEGDTMTDPNAGTIAAHYEGFISTSAPNLLGSAHYSGTINGQGSFSESGTFTANHS